jgi:hypothetical protein
MGTAISRATVSVGPLAANGTTMVITCQDIFAPTGAADISNRAATFPSNLMIIEPPSNYINI